MDTTTPGRLRDAFIAAIKSIVPTHPQHRDRRFRYVRTVDDVPGPSIRNFTIDIPRPGTPAETYGSGVEYDVTLDVYVNYGALAPEADDSILTEDGAQIWDALQALYEPAVPGLISVEPDSFDDGVSEGEVAGFRWGAFGFRVRYLHHV